ncbi:MAG: hypothetical protein Q9181_002391 [Wetmoreana brouardii]
MAKLGGSFFEDSAKLERGSTALTSVIVQVDVNHLGSSTHRSVSMPDSPTTISKYVHKANGDQSAYQVPCQLSCKPSGVTPPVENSNSKRKRREPLPDDHEGKRRRIGYSPRESAVDSKLASKPSKENVQSSCLATTKRKRDGNDEDESEKKRIHIEPSSKDLSIESSLASKSLKVHNESTPLATRKRKRDVNDEDGPKSKRIRTDISPSHLARIIRRSSAKFEDSGLPNSSKREDDPWNRTLYEKKRNWPTSSECLTPHGSAEEDEFLTAWDSEEERREEKRLKGREAQARSKPRTQHSPSRPLPKQSFRQTLQEHRLNAPRSPATNKSSHVQKKKISKAEFTKAQKTILSASKAFETYCGSFEADDKIAHWAKRVIHEANNAGILKRKSVRALTAICVVCGTCNIRNIRESKDFKDMLSSVQEHGKRKAQRSIVKSRIMERIRKVKE